MTGYPVPPDPPWPDEAREIITRLTALCAEGIEVAKRVAELKKHASEVGRKRMAPELLAELETRTEAFKRLSAEIESLRARLAMGPPPMGDRH